MSTVACRHALVACLVVCASAIVCGCGERDTESSASAGLTRDVSSETSATSGPSATSELQNWAKQATGGASDEAAQPAIARAASEPLATPVIHTVD